MKSLNRSLILNTIRTHGEVSRAEIAKITKLTPPTVTNIVSELLDNKLVIESDLGASTGGRRPIMLRINADAYHIVGVDIGIHWLRTVVTNLNADIKAAEKLALPPRVDEAALIGHLIDTVKLVLKKAGISAGDLMGIGLGMHGLVDPAAGKAIFAPNFGLRDISLREPLEREFQVPVHVENDVVAFALGESWFGEGTDTGNFIAVNIGEGVGAGIVLNGQLYKGATYSAGEIGHTTVEMDGPRCTCGNYGCLQSLVSGPALVRQAVQRLEAGERSLIRELCGEDPEAITGEMIAQAARQGDPLAIDLFRRVGRYLGIGLANLINTLNPRKIILGGGVTNAADLFLEETRRTIHERAMDTPANAVSIVITNLGEYASAIGAVTIVLDGLFAPQAHR
jgi:glucokinase-like ROK family protein